MFWIGLIVGIIAGIMCVVVFGPPLAAKLSNMTVDEYTDCIGVIMEAGNNRESYLAAWHDGEILGKVTLEEK